MIVPLDSTDFTDKVALVTGASLGLGREIARKLSILGAHVIAVGTSASHLTTLDDELQKANRTITLAPLDLGSPEKISGLVGGIYQRFGRLDIIVGGAATLGELSPIALSDEKLFARILQVNLHANVTLLRLCHPLFVGAVQPRGVFLSCRLGKASPHWGFYHASKLALEAVVTAYALENPQSHLRVNVLRPPCMHTQLYRQAYPGRNKTAATSTNTDFETVAPPSESTIFEVLHALSLREKRHGSIIDIAS